MHVSDDALISIYGDTEISSGATLSQETNSQYYLEGNLTNNGSLSSSNSQFTFWLATDDVISGTGTTQFFTLNIDKNAETNSLTLDKNIAIDGDLNVNTGIFDLTTFTASKTIQNGTLTLTSNSTIRLGGTNNLLNAVDTYSSYIIDINSIVEFYGTAQTVSNLPINLVSGLGFCILNNPGLKTVNVPLLIRSDLTIINDATLDNLVGVNSLQVNGSVFNDANIENKGIIDIGN